MPSQSSELTMQVPKKNIMVKTALRQTDCSIKKYSIDELKQNILNNIEYFNNNPLFETYGKTEDLTEEYVKPFFDVDVSRTQVSTETEFNILHNNILSFIMEEFKCKIDDIVISTSHGKKLNGEEKWSEHLIIKNKKTQIKNLIDWKSQVTDKLKELYIDIALYAKSHSLRIVGTSKVGENRPLKLINGNFEDHLITNTDLITDIWNPIFVSTQKMKKMDKTLETILTTHPIIPTNELETLLTLISPDCSYEQWLKIGFAVKISGGSFSLFNQWSSNSTKYEGEGKVKEFWDHLIPNGKITIGSLHTIAKKENPKEYKEKIKSEYNDTLYELIPNASKPTDQVASEIIFKCLSIKNIKLVTTGKEEWYIFSNGAWTDEDSSSKDNVYYSILKLYILPILKKMYYDFDPETSLSKLIGLISTTMYFQDAQDVSSCSKFLFPLCHDPNFKNKLDANPYLLGCKNGVLNLKTMEIKPMEALDYITKSTKNNFRVFDEKNKDDLEMLVNVLVFVKQIFPEEDIREYILQTLSLCLLGEIPREKVQFFLGKGRNGKSKLIKLMEYVLGDYCCISHNDLIISGAKPDGEKLSALKGARMAIFQEIPQGSKLNTSFAKQISGNDSFTSRKIYKSQSVWRPSCKTFFVMNKKMDISCEDGAFWKRCELVNFTQTFTENPQFENEQLMDLTLDSKLFKWKECFLFVLSKYLKCLIDKNFEIKVPESIINSTNEYKNSSDTYAKWFKDTYEIIESKDSKCQNHVKEIELWEQFKQTEEYSKDKKSFKKEDLCNSLIELGIRHEPRHQCSVNEVKRIDCKCFVNIRIKE